MPVSRTEKSSLQNRWREPLPKSRICDSQRIFYEATMFVTYAVVNVWTGIKQTGNDPTGTTRVTGCDSLATLTVEVM
ncbi:MAG: hypothetical protein WCH84_06325 [Verrucomicrobiota bacterium]